MERRQRFSFWLFIIAALFLVIFSVQNAHEVTFKLFTWEYYLSLSVLLIVAFLTGLIVGAIFSFRGRGKSKSMETTDTSADLSLKEENPEPMANAESNPLKEQD